MATLKESLSKGITAINVKTSSFMEESKCKTYIATLEKEIQTLKLNMGELIYTKTIVGEDYQENVAEIIQKINEKSSTEAVKYCAKCGAQNAGNYKFCSKCGTPLV